MPYRIKERWLAVFTVMASILVATIMVEIGLAISDALGFKKGLDYADTRRTDRLGPGGYLRENLEIYVTDGYGGKVRWRNNAFGFRSDREFTQEPPPGVLRLLILGDSFAAGFRVGQEDTFPYLLESWINRKYGKAEVLVPMIEEPVTALFYLDRFGLKFKPRVVLMGITLGNDLAQTYFALDPGGEYLLKNKDGKVQIDRNLNPTVSRPEVSSFHFPPEYLVPQSPLDKILFEVGAWLKSFRLAKLLRPSDSPITSWQRQGKYPIVFDANNGLGIFTKSPLPEIEEAYRRLFAVLGAFQAYCHREGIIPAVIIFPQRFQVNPGDWDKAVAEYGLNPDHFDLSEPDTRIRAFCRDHGIYCLDLTEALKERFLREKKPLYLPRGDMHWNKEGHRAFFECAQGDFAHLVEAALRQRNF
jgi:hypothetical protein